MAISPDERECVTFDWDGEVRLKNLVDGSELLRGAQQGSAFHRAALAAVIWHEMAHLDGADERGARKAESTLWASFVRDGLIDQLTGLRYLSALEKRPDDRLLASR